MAGREAGRPRWHRQIGISAAAERGQAVFGHSNSRQDFLSFVVSWLRGSHEFSCHRPFPPNRPCRGQTGKGRAADVRRFLSQASVDARAVLRAVRACFDRIPDPIDTRDFSLPVGLTSGLAVFSPGIPSLLQSGRQVRGGEDPVRARNLRAPFGVGKAPSDTRMRERLDGAGPRGLRRCGPGASTPPCSAARRSRAGRRPAGVSRSRRTGPGAVPRARPSAGAARARTRRDGSRTSCRQAPGAATVRPDHAGAFPPAPEPVRNEDGRRRNDCERNALRRLPEDLRRERPHTGGRPAPGTGRRPAARTSCCVSGEGLPPVPGAKPGDHGPPSGWFDASGTKETWERRDGKTGIVHRFERDRGLPADDANFGLKTDMPGCGETGTKGRVRRFSRAADLPPVRDAACPSCGAAAAGGRPGTRRSRHRDAGGLQLRARLRPWREPPMGRLHDARHARLPDRRGSRRHCCPPFGRARERQERIPCLRDRMREPAGLSSSGTGRPSAARSRESLARRTMPARPCRAVSAPATPGRPRSRPSPATPRSRAAARPPVVRTRNRRPP